jgi:hypothetical protein
MEKAQRSAENFTRLEPGGIWTKEAEPQQNRDIIWVEGL